MTKTRRPRRKSPVEHNPRAFREARLRAGLKQVELAARIGKSVSVISEAESGTRGLSVQVRTAACAVLGCDPITFAPLPVAA